MCFQINPYLSKSSEQPLLTEENLFLCLLSYHQSNVEGRNFLKMLNSKPWLGPLALAFRKARPGQRQLQANTFGLAWLGLAFGLKPSHAHH